MVTVMSPEGKHIQLPANSLNAIGSPFASGMITLETALVSLFNS